MVIGCARRHRPRVHRASRRSSRPRRRCAHREPGADLSAVHEGQLALDPQAAEAAAFAALSTEQGIEAQASATPAAVSVRVEASASDRAPAARGRRQHDRVAAQATAAPSSAMDATRSGLRCGGMARPSAAVVEPRPAYSRSWYDAHPPVSLSSASLSSLSDPVTLEAVTRRRIDRWLRCGASFVWRRRFLLAHPSRARWAQAVFRRRSRRLARHRSDTEPAVARRVPIACRALASAAAHAHGGYPPPFSLVPTETRARPTSFRRRRALVVALVQERATPPPAPRGTQPADLGASGRSCLPPSRSPRSPSLARCAS